MFRNRMLGGVSCLPFYAPETGAGGGGDGGGQREGAGTGGAGSGAAGSGGAAGAAGGAAAGSGTGPGAGGGASGGGTAADKILAGGGAAGADAAAAAAAAAGPAKFPATWREELAGGDAAALKDLAKYTDPNALYKSLRSLQADISTGKLKAPPSPLAENATPEQKAEWRKTNGLPDKPEALVAGLALPDGVVIGEADKPLVTEFAKAMFEQGATQAEMNRAVGWFYQQQDIAKGQREEADSQARVASEVELRGEWGGDFKGNMNAVGAVLALMPVELKSELLSARTESGQLVGNTAAFNRWAAELGRELNPAATLIPAGGSDSVKTVADEIAKIEAKMGDQRSDYWHGPTSVTQQARYRELVDAQQKMAARGKAA